MGNERDEDVADRRARADVYSTARIAEAIFEKIDVLEMTNYSFTLTAHAKARGWD